MNPPQSSSHKKLGLSRLECFNLTFILIGSVLTFVPLFGNHVHEELPSGIQHDSFFTTSCLYRFAIIFVQSIDILVDIIAGVDLWFRTGTMGSGTATGEMRLKNYERGIFIIGIGAIAWVIYAPTDNVGLLYECTANLSIILTICPIIPFLTRCTTTWNTSHLVTTTVTIVLGAVLDSMSLLYLPGADERIRLKTASLVFTVIAAAVIFSACVRCAWTSHIRYLMNKVSQEQEQDDMLNNSAHGHNEEGFSGTTTANDRMLNNFIPACHMIGSLLLVVFYIWSFYRPRDAYFYGVFNYVHLVIGICLLVSEIRLRKNEAARGLVALIESRKAYVR